MLHTQTPTPTRTHAHTHTEGGEGRQQEREGERLPILGHVVFVCVSEACGPRKFEPVSVLETDPKGRTAN